jgi:hypothetical protein
MFRGRDFVLGGAESLAIPFREFPAHGGFASEIG